MVPERNSSSRTEDLLAASDKDSPCTLLKTTGEAATTTDRAERTRLLTIVTAGGGPTGVEVAGMLAEMRKYIMISPGY